MEYIREPVKHTTRPYVTGSSVLGIKCVDGVVLGSDTLEDPVELNQQDVSYGSLAKNRKTSRVFKVAEHCAIGCTGEYSDFQELKVIMESLMISEHVKDDKIVLKPKAIHQYMARCMYGARNKMNPYWNSIVLGGVSQDTEESYLGLVDLYGTNYESEVIATGYGLYIALPLLRKAYRPDITVAQAKTIIEECLTVLYYRDARTIDTIQLTTITKDGVDISDMYKIDSKWDYKQFVAGTRSTDESTW